MILTVTPNSALDKILFIEEWIPGTPMRTSKVIKGVGGKGLDASVVLRHLGVETVGICFVAGRTGEQLLQLLEGYGIIPEPIWVSGETRIAYVISETKHYRHNHIITGELFVTEEQTEELYQRFKFRVRDASWVICSGSVPHGIPLTIYRTLSEYSAQSKVPILVDAAGGFILEALHAQPAIIKMNWAEFENTFQVEAENLDELKEYVGKIYQDKKISALVVTCSSQGILAYSPEGAFHAIAPRQDAVNAAGAGDAVSAALAWRLSEGDSWFEALRWAGAISAAVVLTEGTADCRLQDIRRIYHDVVVQSI